MIANDRDLKVTLDRIAQMQAQVAYVRNTALPSATSFASRGKPLMQE